MLRPVVFLWRSLRWWLFSKGELAQLIRGLQGQIGYCHGEIDRLKAKVARYESAVTHEGLQHYVELRDCVIFADERTDPETGQPLTLILAQPKQGAAEQQRVHSFTVYGSKPVADW